MGFLYYQEHLEHNEQLPEGFTLRHLIARYYGMTSWVDDQVGRLMKGLGDNGLAEDTIVVFLSDHGDNLGSHGLFNKGRLIEESIRISMIWWGPERLQPQVRHGEVASLIDVMPTVLELAGGNTPASVQGQSLVPALLDEGDGPTTPSSRPCAERSACVHPDICTDCSSTMSDGKLQLPEGVSAIWSRPLPDDEPDGDGGFSRRRRRTRRPTARLARQYVHPPRSRPPRGSVGVSPAC
ncbi:MAG: sulfatase-like hydrolase/transferase [Candidatus Latescibacterota bacterium]